MLVETYRHLRNSIVAFIPRFPEHRPDAKTFPPIIGTGVVVHEDGLIATNDHVLDAFRECPRPDDFHGINVYALLFLLVQDAVVMTRLEVHAIFKMRNHQFTGEYYGPEVPDVAFVQVKARRLLPVKFCRPDYRYEEGDEIATAGFPLGSQKLTAPGWVHQLTPTLQTGIISAVHPFPQVQPHGFTVNIMVQGGASGSPVFRRNTGEVIGLIYGGLHEPQQAADGSTFMVPTNFAFAVPSFYISGFRLGLVSQAPFRSVADQAKTVHELVSQAKLSDLRTGEAIDKEIVLPW